MCFISKFYEKGCSLSLNFLEEICACISSVFFFFKGRKYKSITNSVFSKNWKTPVLFNVYRDSVWKIESIDFSMCIMEPGLGNWYSEELIRSVIPVVVFSWKTPSILLVIKATEETSDNLYLIWHSWLQSVEEVWLPAAANLSSVTNPKLVSRLKSLRVFLKREYIFCHFCGNFWQFLAMPVEKLEGWRKGQHFDQPVWH